MCEAYLTVNPNAIQSAPNGTTTWLMHFCYLEDLDAIEFILEHTKDLDLEKRDCSSQTALIICVRNNNLVIAELLLKAGANVNAVIQETGYTPLLMALGRHDLEMAKLLLRYGSDINKVSNNGTTPLMKACWLCSDDEILLIRSLIDNKTDINVRNDSGINALEICCGRVWIGKNNEIIKLFVSMGGTVEETFQSMLDEALLH